MSAKSTFVHHPYARDIMLEAQRLVAGAAPGILQLTLVEEAGLRGFGITKEQCLHYDPNGLLEVSFDALCNMLFAVYRSYLQDHPLFHELAPAGTTIH